MPSENLVRDQAAEEDGQPKREVEFFIQPSTRMSSAICADQEFKDRAFVHGGSGANVGQENYDDLWEFNFCTLRFTQINQNSSKAQSQHRPPGMYGHTVNHFKQALYLFGGTTGFQFFKDVYRYDLITNNWLKIDCKHANNESIPEARYKHCTA